MWRGQDSKDAPDPTTNMHSFMMKKMDARMVKSRLAVRIPVVAEMSWPVPAPDGDIE
ncbi:unnamed protein product [Ectocarpus sp. CCAP 1310/34]|nr:unnamed protein product [Ectocarpus sp. CCAP 1310/34]